MISINAADLKAALPDMNVPCRFAALRSGATVRRDQWGIPHIKADDEYDLFFAQGFATAQDRLFQMDFDRLRALGRASEYLGPKALVQDRLMRRRRFERVSKLDYSLAGSAAKNAIDAYTDGVNAFLSSSGVLPIEYRLLGVQPEPWQPWHCVAVFKVRNTAEGTYQGKLWLARLAARIGAEATAKLSPGYLAGGVLTVPPGGRYDGPVLQAIDDLHDTIEATSILNSTQGGSNAWVVSGKHTESGMPLLAGDSHRNLDVPNVYSQVHLLGQHWEVLGYSIPGFPMALHFCHNRRVAWGMTMGSVDTQDLFVERFRLSDGRMEYLRGNEWHEVAISVETVKVRGGSGEQVEVVETHHGPVIAGEPRSGAAIALADPGSQEATPWIDAAYRAMRAETAEDFEKALEGWTDRVNNYVYADVRGCFGYTLRGRVPKRSERNGWGPVAGWTGQHEWAGYISPAELPRSSNPDAGWAVSCNQRLVDDHYPHYLSHIYGAPYRAERIVTRLEGLRDAQAYAGQKATVADMGAMHGDVTSIPAESIQKALARLKGLSGKTAHAATELIQWDRKITADSARAALYQVTLAQFAERVIKFCYADMADCVLKSSDAGAEDHWRLHIRPQLLASLERGDTSWLLPGECWRDLLESSLEGAIEHLENRFGRPWTQSRWGDLHCWVPQHPLATDFPSAADLLNPPPVETHGDGDTPLMSGSKLARNFLTVSASVTRYIHDPSNWSHGRWIVPLGASGHPGSVHYADQQRLWASNETIPQLWDWDAIGICCETEQRLIPCDGVDRSVSFSI